MFKRQERIQDMDAFVEERLSEYLDGTLSANEREIVERHLATSARARASLESLRYTVNLLKQTPAPTLPRQFTLPVTSRAPVQGVPVWMAWSLRGVAVAATAAFVVLLGATLFNTRENFGTVNDSTAMQAQSQPSAVIALAPTSAAPNAPAQAPASEGADTTMPSMVTVEPATTQETVPITLTPAAVSKAFEPTRDTQEAVPPSAPTQAAAPSANTEPVRPTSAPTTNAADANAAGAAPETLPVTPTETSDAQTQRTMSVQVVEGVVIAVNQLRVRRGPGMHYRALGGLRRNERVMVIGRDKTDNWLAIEFPKNIETGIGWVAARFIKLNAPIDTLPMMDAPESEFPTPTPTATPEATPESDIEPTPEGMRQHLLANVLI